MQSRMSGLQNIWNEYPQHKLTAESCYLQAACLHRPFLATHFSAHLTGLERSALKLTSQTKCLSYLVCLSSFIVVSVDEWTDYD